MLAEIITIGDEILIGQTVDTNSAWMGEQLHLIGVKLNRVVTISDTREAILEAIDESFSRADLILMTGGLGPTKDDVTKETLAEYFDTKLERNQEVLDRIESYFESRGFPILETNRQQADLPASAEVMLNMRGTAMGMWFQKGNKALLSMPGVPYEMKGIMRDHGLYRIKSMFEPNTIIHKTVLTQGVGESFIADKMSDWENRLRAEGLALAYLPSPGMVKLRLTGYPLNGESEAVAQRMENYINELQEAFPANVYGRERDKLAQVVGELMMLEGETVATAESCTGGTIAQMFTENPGSSNYFLGGAVTYSNKAKTDILGVTPELIEKHGAVSEEVVKEMAEGACQKFGATYAIATSGVAGPDGGTETKPVGTVWIGLATPDGVQAQKWILGRSRSRNITVSAQTALNWLRNEIIKRRFE